jgi:serine/threonine-protein kinase
MAMHARKHNPTMAHIDASRDVFGPRNALVESSEARQPGWAGRYQLLRPIARGGMGAVWIGRVTNESGFEKIFAVKTLLSHLAGDCAFREMFLDEARIAAGIEHPNVAQIIDAGEDGDLLYLVMEWIEGESLHALARTAEKEGGTLPLGVVLRILSDACSGLHAVHEHCDWSGRPLDIVHRDVSPHNLLVSSHGVTKLIDFGVALSRDRYDGESDSGQVKGKIRYMAPEQARGAHIDRRADVWSIGAVLYKVVTGRYPYPGESEVDFLRMLTDGRHADKAPQSVPAPVRRVLDRALAFDRADRYPTAEELADALDTAASELGILTDQRGVAACILNWVGPRLARNRAALRTAVEQRDSSDRINALPTLPSREASNPSRCSHAPMVLDNADEVTSVDPRLSWRLAIDLRRKAVALTSLAFFLATVLLFVSQPAASVVPAASAEEPFALGRIELEAPTAWPAPVEAPRAEASHTEPTPAPAPVVAPALMAAPKALPIPQPRIGAPIVRKAPKSVPVAVLGTFAALETRH